METPAPSLLLLLLVCFILADAFFSLVETALTKSHKTPLEKMAEDGNRDARAALAILENPDETRSVVQIGITLMGILSGLCTGLLAAPILAQEISFLPHSYGISLAASILSVTYFLLLLGEFLPKKIALQHPEDVLLKHHRALGALARIARPFVAFLSRSANFILLVFGINPQVEETVTEDEVKDLIEQGTEDGTFEKTEQAMVDRIFKLSDQTAYSLMTPRTRMLWLDVGDSERHNLRLVRQHPQSVFAVGKESPDNFLGVLRAKDLLDAMLDHKSPDIQSLVKKPLFVPRSMETFRLLNKFTSTGIHEAVVQDEYGGVVGFITLGDIMGEILGNSGLNRLKDTTLITGRDESSWLVAGLCSIDDFKEQFDLEELPKESKDHYQTMGGFLTSYFGYIPQKGERIAWNGFSFEVLAMDRARIDKILVSRVNEGNEALSTQGQA